MVRRALSTQARAVNGEQVLTQLLERGSAARATGATLMNQASSRSHAIFTLTLEQHRPQVNAWTRSTRLCVSQGFER
jgi:hypothetical protein